jgi:hypothetical protein
MVHNINLASLDHQEFGGITRVAFALIYPRDPVCETLRD